MKFTLTYEGELRAGKDWRREWEIREALHPQLEELWRITPALIDLRRKRHVPKGGYWQIESHHTIDDTKVRTPSQDDIDLLEEREVGGRRFLPLVRNSLALNCGLKILFLRKEEPGKIYQGGDLDNRIKTLFDALSIPNDNQIMKNSAIIEPMYCLLEDDALVTRMEVDTHRLLSRPSVTEHYVSLIIEVDVKVAQPRVYNQPFLGG
jgi:hypothetical protein